jgi:hypothetical protein
MPRFMPTAPSPDGQPAGIESGIAPGSGESRQSKKSGKTMEYNSYLHAAAVVMNWDGLDLDDLLDAIAGMREHGILEGPLELDTIDAEIVEALLYMEGHQPAEAVWRWPDDEDVAAQDAGGRILRWSDLEPGFAVAA